jgi:hypothetical protein
VDSAARGDGCGTHQAADSGVNVANLVCHGHRIRRSAFERSISTASMPRRSPGWDQKLA